MLTKLKSAANSFLIALQFLTTIPVFVPLNYSQRAQGQALLWYPVVGLLLACVLLIAAAILPANQIGAALLLVIWVLLTGALHLDGLADCSDAFFAAMGDKEKTLRILKDPLNGTMAVVSIVLVLLVKFVALSVLLSQQQFLALVLILVLSRSAVLLLFISVPYVREQGLGSVLAQHFSKNSAMVVLLTVVLLSFFALPITLFLSVYVATVVVFLSLKMLTMKVLGGFTGDVAGSLIELEEVILLVLFALWCSA